MQAFFSLVLLTTFCSSPAFAEMQLIDRIEASVNGSIVFNSDLEKWREMVPLRSQLDPLFANSSISQKGASAPLDEIVQFLIDEKMVAAIFPVTDTEVEQEVNSIQANNKISREKLRSALEDQGFRFIDYFELIRSSAAKKNLLDREIRAKVSISDDDVKNHFYNEQKRDSAAALQYHLRMIRISGEQYKSHDITKQQAQLALDSLKAGTPFEETAKRYSDDESSQSGGDLGLLSEDMIAKDLLPYVKKMKIGEISPLIPFNNTGFLILKLVDISSSDQDSYQKAKEELRLKLINAEYRHQIQLWLERQREKSFIHIHTKSS